MGSCGTCQFSNLVIFPDGPNMECRRYPPSFASLDGDVAVAFPQVRADEWCGEFVFAKQESEGES